LQSLVVQFSKDNLVYATLLYRPVSLGRNSIITYPFFEVNLFLRLISQLSLPALFFKGLSVSAKLMYHVSNSFATGFLFQLFCMYETML
ncbi:hypothetical protein, partial [Paenibacillus sp. UNC499MF]|uniref:hypothetical protein n=1 Tax=Paenibacillus sp. UNC499MF TaxID=1502751 RepID=UPI001CA528B4